MCQAIVLSKKGSVIITQCMDCKNLNIWNQTLLLNFTPEQFRAFKNFTENLDTSECLFPFPDGEDRLVLRTPNIDINFIFTLNQWEDLHIAMEEAEYMQDVYSLIN